MSDRSAGRVERPEDWPETIGPKAEVGHHLMLWNPNEGLYVCVCGHTEEEP